MTGIPSFNDTIIEHKVERERKGKTAISVDTHYKVCEGSFAVGREVRDILWPPTCTVLSVDRSEGSHASRLKAGDVLHVHYATYDPEQTSKAMCDILGEQTKGKTKSHIGTDKHTVPMTE